MKYPIVAYGDPVLRRKATSIEPDEYPNIKQTIDDLFETMYAARGVGLAAPQVGLSMRLFVVDASVFADEEPELKDFKKTFINACIEEETGEEWPFNEGCLSIPDIREDVYRKPNVRLSYYDEEWKHHEEIFTALSALMNTLPRDGQEIQTSNYQYLNQSIMNQHSVTPNPLLNPIAWGSFINQISQGDKSRQSSDSN